MKKILIVIAILFIATPCYAGATTVYSIRDIIADTIQFDLNSGATCEEGMIKWNSDDKTMDICTENSEVTIQVGQEMHVRGTNKTGVTLTNGQVVFINGAQGQRPTFGLANATSEVTSSKTIGIVTADITDNLTGYVTTTGLVRDLDTSTMIVGNTVWLSTTSGEYTDEMPVTPNHAVSLGVVINSHASEGIIYVSVINGQELYEAHDVYNTVSTAIANNLLAYDGTAWSNTADIFVNSITYENTYWDDFRVALVSARPAAVSPTLSTFIQNTVTYHWSDNSTTEAVHFTVQMPHGYTIGTDLEAHLHANAGSNSNSGNVEAILECTDLVDIDGTFPNTTNLLSAIVVADGTAYKNYYQDFGTIDGSGATKVSALMQCRVTRNGSTSGDVSGDFVFLDVDFHYEIDTPGSETEDAK